jgi:hypothetical protein
MPLLTDADFFLENLDPNLFPGVSTDIKVHNGFKDAHAEYAQLLMNLIQAYWVSRTAQDVLAAVNQTMQDHSTNKVTVAGHSLGQPPASSISV